MSPDTTATVPATPVVAVSITDDEITVNGQRVAREEGKTPHETAIHAVARQVAQTLGRPVRAIATDHSGRTALVVHPDGRASDVVPAPPAPEPAPALTLAPPVEPTQDLEALFAASHAREEHHAAAPEATHTLAAPVPTATLSAPASADHTEPADHAGSQEAAPTTTPAEQVTASSTQAKGPAHRAPRANRSFLTVHQDNRPAESGWRGLMTRLGVTTEPTEAEKAERADVRAVSQHWPGPRTIAVVNGKGGANKTPTAVLLSAMFSRNGGSGVLAWDNNETRGTLGWRTEQGPHESHVLELLPHAEDLMQPTARAADLAAFVHHQVDDKFDVLRSNPLLLPHQQRLTAHDFDAIHQVATKYFRLIFIDSGNDETAPHWLRMIDHADQLVLATTTRPDHAEAGRLLLDALRERDEHSAALAEGAVAVISQADREEASAATIAEAFDGLVRDAVTIPYDKAMREPWLRVRNLAPTTQRAFLRAAAAVAEGL